MLLSKLGSDAGSESSTRTDARSPATQRIRLPVPKDQISHPGKLQIIIIIILAERNRHARQKSVLKLRPVLHY